MMELEPHLVRSGSGAPGLFPPALPRPFYQRPVPPEFGDGPDRFAAAWVAMSPGERERWRQDQNDPALSPDCVSRTFLTDSDSYLRMKRESLDESCEALLETLLGLMPEPQEPESVIPTSPNTP